MLGAIPAFDDLKLVPQSPLNLVETLPSLASPDVSPNAWHLHPKNCISTVMSFGILSEELWS